MEEAGSSKRGCKPSFPWTYPPQHSSGQHTRIHAHRFLFVGWHRPCIVPLYTGRVTPQHRPWAWCGSGVSFALEQGLPKGQVLQSPSAAMAATTPTGKEGVVAAPRAKGPMVMASFLQRDHNMALGGRRHFFSPITLHGAGETASRDAPCMSP